MPRIDVLDVLDVLLFYLFLAKTGAFRGEGLQEELFNGGKLCSKPGL